MEMEGDEKMSYFYVTLCITMMIGLILGIKLMLYFILGIIIGQILTYIINHKNFNYKLDTSTWPLIQEAIIKLLGEEDERSKKNKDNS